MIECPDGLEFMRSPRDGGQAVLVEYEGPCSFAIEGQCLVVLPAARAGVTHTSDHRRMGRYCEFYQIKDCYGIIVRKRVTQ